MNRIVALLTPPIFEGDEERTRQARLLYVCLWTLIFLVTLLAVIFANLPLQGDLHLFWLAGIVDITSLGFLVLIQREGQDALHEGAAQYHMLFEESPIGMEILQADESGYRIAAINPAGCQILGYSQSELVGMNINQLIDPADLAQQPVPPPDEMQSGLTLRRERIIIRKDGTRASLWGGFKHMPNGKLLYIFQDITERKRTEVKTQRQLQELTTLHSVANSIAEAKTENELLELVTEIIGSTFFPADFGVMLIETASGLLQIAPSYRSAIPLHETFIPAGRGIVSWVATTGQSCRVADVSHDPHYHNHVAMTRSELCVPIKIGERILGVINAESNEPEAFSEDDERLLLTIAGHLATALDHLRSEDALRKSEARYRAVVENQTEFIVRWKPDGTHTFVNDAYCRYFGITSEQALSTSFLPLIVEEDRHSMEERILRLMSDGISTETYVHRVTKPDNSIGWQEWTDQTIRDERGDVAEFQSVGRDITERKQADEKLKQFREVMDESNDAIFLIDPATGRYIDFNQTALNYLQYSRDELSHTGIIQIAQHIHNLEGWHERVALVEKEHGLIFETEYQRKDKTTFPVEVSARMLEYENKMIIGAVVRDITKRKRTEEALRESEEHYRHLAQATVEGIAIGADGIFIDANPQCAQMFGYTLDEFLGMPIQRVVPPEDQEKLAQILNSGQEDITEQRVIRKDGTMLIAEVHSLPTVYKGQAARVAAVHDITERKRAEEALRESEAIYRKAIEVAGAVPYRQSYGEGFSTNFEFIGEGIQKITGYGSEEFNEKVWDSLVQESNLIGELAQYPWREAIERVRSGSSSIWQCEQRILTREGKTRWIYEAAVELRDKDGKSHGSIGLFQDITDRKRVEAALSESEALYRQAIEVAGAVPYRQKFDQQGKITYEFMGEGIREITGYGPDEFTDNLWGSLTQERHLLEDLALYPLDEAVQRVRSGKSRIWKCEHRIMTRDGRTRWVFEAAVDLRDEHGIAYGSIGMYQDITARKQAEEEVRKLNAELETRVKERTAQLNEANQNLHQEKVRLEQYSRQRELMGTMTDLLQASLTTDEASNIVSRYLQLLFPNRDGALYLLNASGTLEPIAVWGEQKSLDTMFGMNDCWALRRGKPYRFGSGSPNPPCAHVGKEITQSALCIPLTAQGESMGSLHISTENIGEGGFIDDEEQRFIETIADSVALALANVRLRERLRIQSIRDGLTGLFNRRYLDETLPREIHRAERNQRPISVLMFDLDSFKRINDTYGHDAGDTVLKRIAEILTSKVRPSDIACRYGGEEFTVILPDTSLEVAHTRAESLREVVSQTELQHNGKDLGTITISMGVATYPQHGITRDALIKAADEASYQAKQTGKNRVILAVSK